ncbi:hypothetical protein B0O99DRAFT_220689 [Bisporella sp. PMI_857]|nr:hypothetical protein B0O99DRAFT_220689 [Bisporella sp. PMI_857]
MAVSLPASSRQHCASQYFTHLRPYHPISPFLPPYFKPHSAQFRHRPSSLPNFPIPSLCRTSPFILRHLWSRWVYMLGSVSPKPTKQHATAAA